MVALKAVFAALFRSSVNTEENVQNSLLELADTLYGGESYAFGLGNKFDSNKFESILAKLCSTELGQEYVQELVFRALPQKRELAKRCAAFKKSKNTDTFLEFLLPEGVLPDARVREIVFNFDEKKSAPIMLAVLVLLPELEQKSPITLSLLVAYEESKPFALELANGAMQHRAFIEDILKKYTSDGDLTKIDPLTLAVLLVAGYEFFFAVKPQPPLVIVNEAIELAKEFGKETAAPFINAVLSKMIEKEKREGV